MGRIVHPDWYVESIDMWIRKFILICMWIRSPVFLVDPGQDMLRGTDTRIVLGPDLYVDAITCLFDRSKHLRMWAGSIILINPLKYS